MSPSPTNGPKVVEPALPLPVRTEKGSPSDPPTVLMVDDEPMIVEVGRHFLLRLGWEVVTADSGETALANLDDETRRPSAAVIDLNMPGIDGLETFERLRARLCTLGVVFTSGEDMAPLARRFGEDARVAFLQKPFTLKDFEQALVEVLGRPSPDVSQTN